MRFMQLPCFPTPPIVGNFYLLLHNRLASETTPYWDHGVHLIAYMAWPNDEERRQLWSALCSESVASQFANDKLFKEFTRSQRRWARIAALVGCHYDIAMGGH